jgi:hypothetical protein
VKYEGLISTADITGTFDVHWCCKALDLFSDGFRTLKSQDVNDARGVSEARRHFRMLDCFDVNNVIARYLRDLMFSIASSESCGSGWN